MALVATSGAANANAYDTAANADAYFADRGIDTWTGATADKEEALIRGADYIDNYYHGRWLGLRTYEIQSMDWPRSWVTDVDGYAIEQDEIPTRLKEANYEAAFLILIGGETLEPTIERRETSKRVKAGPVEVTTAYSEGSSRRKDYSQIHDRIKPLLLGGGGTVPLLRV